MSYELGETYLSLLETKLDKFRVRGGSGIDEKTLKPAEIAKSNSYCQGAIAMFAHFSHLYARSDERKRFESAISPFTAMSLEQLKDIACTDPDESEWQYCFQFHYSH